MISVVDNEQFLKIKTNTVHTHNNYKELGTTKVVFRGVRFDCSIKKIIFLSDFFFFCQHFGSEEQHNF